MNFAVCFAVTKQAHKGDTGKTKRYDAMVKDIRRTHEHTIKKQHNGTLILGTSKRY